jgi:hypothetical protein
VYSRGVGDTIVEDMSLTMTSNSHDQRPCEVAIIELEFYLKHSIYSIDVYKLSKNHVSQGLLIGAKKISL